MKLTEALKLIQSGDSLAPPHRTLLACGFSPLHLKTYLHAWLQRKMPSRKVDLEAGLFGDIKGTLERALTSVTADAVAVALEWSDLDPRLGYRNLGGWGPRQEDDILKETRRSLAVLKPLLNALADRIPVALALPSLELPPAFHTSGRQFSPAALALEASLLTFAAEVSTAAGSLSVAHRDHLSSKSPAGARLDLKSELFHGFPYTQEYASHLAESLACLLAPATPFKGLITDLDDTLWGGIIGEVGESNVAWDLTSHTQLHGLYQQTLYALADQGVLLGVASKNDAATAQRGLERDDVILPASKLFPLEIHWQPKSSSVTRILEAWNIGPDAVIFIDDSPMEVAEVQAAHPKMECILFPKTGYAEAVAFLRHLRDRFGKPRLSEADELRRESLRQAAAWRQSMTEEEPSEDFLASIGAIVHLQADAVTDPRALELVNKTNQFNLNGRRYDEGTWKKAFQAPGAFVWTVSYQDKFGPLGKIAVVAGRHEGSRILVDTWVMSCRAFARRIEHQTLAQLFEQFQAAEIEFDHTATGRNGPSSELLRSLTGEHPSSGKVSLTLGQFARGCPVLMHQVKGSGVQQALAAPVEK